MNKNAFNILRVGMAIIFLWIGILILRSPEGWGTLIQPWAAGLLPVSLRTAMIGTAILDLSVGFFLLINLYTFFFAALGFLHLLTVVIVVGINPITIRDIGLAAATLALALESWPKKKTTP